MMTDDEFDEMMDKFTDWMCKHGVECYDDGMELIIEFPLVHGAIGVDRFDLTGAVDEHEFRALITHTISRRLETDAEEHANVLPEPINFIWNRFYGMVADAVRKTPIDDSMQVDDDLRMYSGMLVSIRNRMEQAA